MSTTIHIDRTEHSCIRIDTDTEAPPAAPLVVLSMTHGGITSTHTGALKMSYTLPIDKQVELRISYVDAAGNPASVDGVVRWDSSNVDIATVEQLAPEQQTGVTGGAVMLVAVGVGSCQISAHADADLGSGVRPLITLMDVDVVGGEAVAGTITPHGEATDQP